MIELTVLNYLNTKFTEIPVTMENIDETEYVLVSRTSSGMNNFVKSATFAIQSYSNSLYNAAVLNEAVKTAMLGNGTTSYGIVAENSICKCTLNSDYYFADTTSKKYRYQAVFDISYQ